MYQLGMFDIVLRNYVIVPHQIKLMGFGHLAKYICCYKKII